MLVFVINRLFICVLRTIEEEKEKSKKEVGEELTAQQAEWQQEVEQRLRAEVLEQMQVEQQLLRERQSRVELREQGLASLAEQLTAVHDDINQRLSQLSVGRTSFSFFIPESTSSLRSRFTLCASRTAELGLVLFQF